MSLPWHVSMLRGGEGGGRGGRHWRLSRTLPAAHTQPTPSPHPRLSCTGLEKDSLGIDKSYTGLDCTPHKMTVSPFVSILKILAKMQLTVQVQAG